MAVSILLTLITIRRINIKKMQSKIKILIDRLTLSVMRFSISAHQSGTFFTEKELQPIVERLEFFAEFQLDANPITNPLVELPN